jgi:sugar/nucleoside kinase (ribokinase family)
MREPRRGPPRDLLIAGHVNVDRFLEVREFPGPDRTVPLRSDRAALGGTAANLALVAARLGLAAGLVSRVGDGFPEPFRRQLLRAGIDLRGLESVRGRPTPICYIVEDARGGQRTLIDQGPMADGRAARLPGAWLADYGWLHMATGDPEFQLRLAAAARSRGLRVAVDPAQEIFYRWTGPKFRRLLGYAELLFGNRSEIQEAARLAGSRGVPGLLERVPLVVRTEGARGAVAFSRAGTARATPRLPKRVRTLVGAGDAFRGGFYSAWLGGDPLSACLGAGTRTACRWIEGRL